MKKIILLIILAASPFAFLPAGAQDASSTGASIGPAPAHTKQHEILTGALSPETRETLQRAMDSETDANHSVPVSK